jgi:leucyl aminopeptidase
VEVEVRDTPLTDVDADLLCLGLFEDEGLPEEFASAPGSADVKAGYKKTTLIRPERPARVLAVGLGKRGEFDPERARVAAALAARQAKGFEARSVAWAVPDADEADAVAGALVEGTILASFRFDRFKGSEDDEDDKPRVAIETVTVIGDEAVTDPARAAGVAAEAQNRSRELQKLPSNYATPTFLAQRAEEIAAASEGVTAEILDREQIEALGMGGLTAVSQGSHQDPRLIILRYSAGAEDDPKLGLVGKGVTFDSGGISIKPSQKMDEMKMDMSGGATVLESVAAIAELGLKLNLIAVIPATENMPSGHAIKPGDIIKQYNGKTVEVLNTDAEGRLILADALAFCAEQGADRIVDLATLTGAVVVALGSTYAALISNDDEWAAEVEAAATETGELAWRLPLHPEYKELTKGEDAELSNASAKGKAGTIYAGSFLEEFVDGKPWAHLDIAGTAWDVGREYVGKAASGYGVRLLVALARRLADKK